MCILAAARKHFFQSSVRRSQPANKLVVGFSLFFLAPLGWAADPELISVQAGTNRPAGFSRDAAISGDGRFVTFLSSASTLVPGAASGYRDVFIRDRVAGVTQRVSVGLNGALPNGDSGRHDVSHDGRFVVFESDASNLVGGDTNGQKDIFLRDRLNRTTRRISLTASGGQIYDGGSEFPAITPNGRFVCFFGNSDQILPSDTRFNVVVRDLATGSTELANFWNNGVTLSATWDRCAMSADGRFVTFSAAVRSLDPFDPNAGADDSIRHIFVRDRSLDRTEVASVKSSGSLASNQNDEPTISDDGRYVFFMAYGPDLVPNDTNDVMDIVGRDRLAGTTGLVTVNMQSHSYHPATNSDGRYVVFSTIPLGYHDYQVMVRDRVALQTRMLTLSGDNFNSNRAISADGRYVAFYNYDTGDVYVDDRALDLGYELYLRPLAIEYGQVALGTVLKKGFTLTNAGARPLPISTIELRGMDRSQYSLKSYCGSTIPVGRWCWISVTFAPRLGGYMQANLHVVAGGIDRHRALRGTGVYGSSQSTREER